MYIKMIETSMTWKCPKSGTYKIVCVAGGESGAASDAEHVAGGAVLPDENKNVNIDVDLSDYVPNTRKVNDKPLTNDIVLTASDVEAEPVIAVGTSSDYYAGDKSWKDLGNGVRSTVLTGLSTANNTPIVATDSVITALGKLQSQNIIQSGTANLTNTLAYPFNNSTYTVALSPAMPNTNYIINIEPPTDLGGTIGRVIVSDKLNNGFKISYTGSATSADLKWIVKG